MARKKRVDPTGDLFIADSGQLKLVDKSAEQEALESQRVECLGMTFESEDTRREHFLSLLAEKLKDPEFRKTPGFPIAEDEDILRLSDPPYYTACPNPFLEDYVACYGTPYEPDKGYHREPFAVDVSVGKTDPLYRAHGYHTKVPHLAIVPSILHYTNPGDIVLDGFCGSGMTGVAAQYCGSAPKEYRQQIEMQWKKEGREAPEWSVRRSIQGDLSPAATFIAANYNLPFNVRVFEREAKRILKAVNDELGWMYETLHTDGKTKGRINYTVWSEVFSCPNCTGQIEYLRETLDPGSKRVADEFTCPGCGVRLKKTQLERVQTTHTDALIGGPISDTKRVPVLINYTVGSNKYEKEPTEQDLILIRRISEMPLPGVLPSDRMMHSVDEVWGDEWRAGVASFSHVHHLFLPRQSHALAALWTKTQLVKDSRLRAVLLFAFEQAIWGMSLMNRYAPTHFSQVNRFMSGRLRVLSQTAECSPWYILGGKIARLAKAFKRSFARAGGAILSTGDCANLPLAPDCADYIFTDPPFGHNFAYAELNFIVEAWHRVFTSQESEAIVSAHQRKRVFEYQELMNRCFSEYFRVLKPGRWMTVVFSNSRNAIWRAIQEGIGAAGFVIADVRSLDKQQGSFNQVHGVSPNTDLVISAYKPTSNLERRTCVKSVSDESAWAFVREHLGNLPIFVARNDEVEVIAERTPQVLLDRMIAFHVQRSMAVPLSSPEFFAGLDQRLPGRDGMYFLPEQAAQYDRKRISIEKLQQLSLFPTDEASAIVWLRQQLQLKPQTYQELAPAFMKEIHAWMKHEQTVELRVILEQNFLCFHGAGPVPSQIHSYLSTNFKDLRKLGNDDPKLIAKARDRWYVPDPKKQGDLEKTRIKQLLREFEDYKSTKERRFKVFRTEAVRAGFKAAYDANDYQTIIAVAAKLPETALQEDEKLLMYYDVASTRLGDE